jgi:hypothetical protein
VKTVALPYQQRQLDKRDLDAYENILAHYLDIQKGLDYEDLTKEEIKGRWKSFMGKWNRGELAEGWYDPQTKRKADEGYKQAPVPDTTLPTRREPLPSASAIAATQDDDSDDGYGPPLPAQPPGVRRIGPVVPRSHDLQHRDELSEEAAALHRADQRHERKQERALQKERVEELAPRADPGSRERKLEKKADKTGDLHAARDAKEGGEAEVGDGELLGDDAGDGFKKEVQRRQRVKSERELRKEETLRARMAEREERMRGVREKEAKTMDMLKSIAKERFG